ncbi:NADH dehydrogenase 1 beta subcomplex subunit 3 [Cytidiella melzeri]|nr:NADH dehydrogenase 1 beta subcomplex subunit 3 [Cytidiella melzeri]
MSDIPPPSLFRNPWAKRDAWRKHPVFTQRAMFSKMFPGFGVAVVAFTAYVAAETMLFPEKKQHH